MIRIISIIIFLMTYTPFALFIYLVFDGELAIALSILSFISYLGLYIYLDRVILVFLKAREVIDTDAQEIFQTIKNNTYRRKEKLPKLYIYDGNVSDCFVFEGLFSWSIVMSRKMVNRLSDQSRNGVIDFAFEYKHRKIGLVKTKTLGVCVCIYFGVFSLMKFVFRYKPNSIISKSMTSFFLMLTKPFVFPLETVLKYNLRIHAQVPMKEFHNMLEERNVFYDLLLKQVIGQKYEQVIINYIEGFSLLWECDFQK